MVVTGVARTVVTAEEEVTVEDTVEGDTDG